MQHFVILAAIFCIWLDYGNCVDVGLTVDVAPGTRECFYQDINAGTEYEVEYQVLSGGELDIIFSIHVSSGMSVFMGTQKTGDTYKNVAIDSGEHVFCLDNSFSQISTKTVYFELYVKDITEASSDILRDITASPELLQFEVSLENFKNATNSVEDNLQRSLQIQRQFASVELRDRSIQEYNFERVNFWSSVQLFVMVSVAIVNVLMIRGLFDDRRRVKSSNVTKLRT